jgi:hypothetical protein
VFIGGLRLNAFYPKAFDMAVDLCDHGAGVAGDVIRLQSPDVFDSGRHHASKKSYLYYDHEKRLEGHIRRGCATHQVLARQLIEKRKTCAGLYWENAIPIDRADRISMSFPHAVQECIAERQAKRIAEADKFVMVDSAKALVDSDK